MKRLSTILVFLTLIIVLTVGCASILDGYFQSERRHVAPPYVPEPVEHISVSDIGEFTWLLIELIMEHETEAHILYHHFGTEDIQEELEFAAEQIKRSHPIGAFAVSNIAITVTRIVTYFEVDVTIEYKRTEEELAEIITVATESRMMSELLNVMRQHTDQAVFQSTLQFTEEIIAEKIRYIYYNNPGEVVMLPIVTVEMFPQVGSGRIYPISRIYSIQFSYMYDSAMMRQFGGFLSLYVERNAGRITGDTDSLKLLNLVRDLAASIEFDEGTARTISVHGAQNISATAFGALVRNRAVGEGFAMAFKALSNELGFDNRIVLGYLDGRHHAWNIVELDGYFYHIDVAMIAMNAEYGLETAFLRNDDDFEAMGYEWDRENTVICDGPLTFEDILALEEPDYYDEYGDESENGESSSVDDEQDNTQDNVQDAAQDAAQDNQEASGESEDSPLNSADEESDEQSREENQSAEED